jgi:hypothetical protein
MQDWNKADALGSATQNLRKGVAFFTYRGRRVQYRKKQPISPAELKDQAACLRSEAQSRELATRHKAIWALESLGSAYASSPSGDRSFNVADLDRAIVPVLHVGAGLGIVESVGFDPARIREAVDAVAQPDYREFPYETVGAMLAHFTDAPKLIARLLGMKDVTPPSDPASYVAQFEGETRRVLSHGYGRILYFSRLSLAKAIGDALDRAYLNRDAAVQGIAFAYSIANFQDIFEVFRTAWNLRTTTIGSSFREGVTYAAVSVEWMLPGYLAELKQRRPHGVESFQQEMIEAAERNIGEFQRMGRIDTFRLPTPVMAK